MHSKILSLLLVFSLAFNIAFVGIWVYNLTEECEPAEAPLNELRLGPDQQRRVREQWQQLRKQVADMKEELDRERDRLLDLMAAERPDTEAIRDCQSRIGELQHEMRRIVTEHMMQTGQMLTPEQRARWYGMMKGLGQRHGRRTERLRRPPGRGEGRFGNRQTPREP